MIFKMIVQGDLTDEHPKYYHKVHVEYHFYGSNLQQDKINKAVTLSVTDTVELWKCLDNLQR